MMKTRLTIILWFLIIQQLMLACSDIKSEAPFTFDEEYINQQIKLLAPKQFNNFETTSSIVLEVQYHSKNEIVFPNNYNVRIFEQTDNGWVEVQEKPTLRLPEDDIIFSTEMGTTAKRLFTVDLELAEYAQTSLFRFYIFGDMKVDQGIKQVAAYVDIELSP